MRVLLVGNGGREHAIAWRLRRSKSVTEIVCPNGNPGIAREAQTPRVVLQTPAEWAAFALECQCDLVVVGPEAPLAAGVGDACEDRGIAVFGPRADGARIESSKAFAKDVMQAAGIPTARSEAFSDYDKALDYGRSLGLPVVVKADGLAAGKGVAICETGEQLAGALAENLKDGRFGDASRTVLVEEFLRGEEVSILAVTDGQEVFPLVPSQDHKRALDGDLGPNTGGMGAYAPAPVCTDEILSAALTDVLRPAIRELARRGIAYKGVLYAGLMVTDDGLRVLEFNCRFGDPETQVVLPLLDGDLGELMLACCEGRLGELVAPLRPGSPDSAITMRPEHAICLVLASGGYPDAYTTGKVISGLNAADDDSRAVIFHAGTVAGADGEVLTAGGRVLGLTAWGASLEAARDRVYELAGKVSFEGCHFRHDIAHRALSRRNPA
ncbi:MAG: phosphoribosylamine---glycine ligase [Candidatus Sumerlaeota bacterium]|nr:phosphoribosylamine---glycine ligase [Candidatus Sumerlaeota bacterium]